MKIVIADGKHQADYIINVFNTPNNNLIIINDDLATCEYLSAKNNVSVIHGRCTKENDLALADAEDADLFIALNDNDITNYVACQTAKQIFNCKRCISKVMNPKNVDIFKKLGVDSVVSSTYLLCEHIKNEAIVDDMIKTLSLEDNKIQILEIKVNKDSFVCNKNLIELPISDYGTISAIYRNQRVIIPHGPTILLADDKVLIVTTNERKDDVLNIFKKENNA